MSRIIDRLSRVRRSRLALLTLTLAAALFALPASRVDAQYMGYGYPGVGAASAFGYGYGGYGVPGYGLGYGYPGAGFGYGYPGFGYGGFGYGGLGYGGFYGGGFAYGGPGVSIVTPTPYGLTYGYGAPGPGVYNPLFGVGLTPLGVNSAMTERYMLGRGVSNYTRGYGPAAAPRAGVNAYGPGVGTVNIPVPAPAAAAPR